jgi:hypothetical protein
LKSIKDGEEKQRKGAMIHGGFPGENPGEKPGVEVETGIESILGRKDFPILQN